VWPRIYREGAAKTLFSRFMARPLVARAVSPEWDLPKWLARNWKGKACLETEQFFK
jgi:hypothetical protein